MAQASARSLRGRLRHDEPMAAHCSWRAGGPAARFYEPADLDDLAVFIAAVADSEPILWLGLGSNVLVRDGGFQGTVVCVTRALGGLRFLDETTLCAQAGVPCAHLARAAARVGLTGAEFFAGIPGTLGGALAMNAGAFGTETWSLVRAVQTLDRRGQLHQRSPGEFCIAYRSVTGPGGEWFVAATLALEHDPSGAGAERIRALLARRQATQPLGAPSCGSVFRNPPGDHAARLIEDCGLKGLRVGDAYVSDKHANFIINAGHASAADIEALIDSVRAAVARKHGVTLEPEVRIVGRRP